MASQGIWVTVQWLDYQVCFTNGFPEELLSAVDYNIGQMSVQFHDE
jgi:hypothetical protein